MFNLIIDYPTIDEETEIVKKMNDIMTTDIKSIINIDMLLKFQNIVVNMPVADNVVDFAVKLVRSTRIDKDSDASIKKWLNWGAGPRASAILILAAKANALIEGRTTPEIEDIKYIAKPVLRHRIIPNFNAEAEGLKSDDILDYLLKNKLKSTILNPEIINQLDSLYLKAKMIVEGYMSGLHKSPYHGFSIEFSEHKAYGVGDETRNIDWKLWGKTDKYYVKRFEEETNMSAHIFLDSSKSMAYTSNSITKFEYAKLITATFGYLMMQQKDATGLSVFDTKIKYSIHPKNSKSHLNTLLSIVENTKIGEDTNISKVLHIGAEKIKKKGLIILISDLLDEPIKIINSLKHFKYNKNEVLVFHLLDPKELTLEFNEHTIFEDLEDNTKIETEPWLIANSYKREIENLINFYKTECLINKIDYHLVKTNQDIGMIITKFLNKRKKLL